MNARVSVITVLAAAMLTACPAQDRVTGISANANPTTISVGETSSLNATVTGTGNFNPGVNWSIVSGGGSLSSSTGSNITYTAPATPGNVQLRASAAGDANISQTLSLSVQAGSPPIIQSFTATPGSLPAGGGNVTLAWNVTGATSLALDNSLGDVTGFSQKTINLTASRTFTLTATNPQGQTSASVDVIVGSPATQAGVWDQSNWNEANWQ